jgi:hypothetical protein
MNLGTEGGQDARIIPMAGSMGSVGSRLASNEASTACSPTGGIVYKSSPTHQIPYEVALRLLSGTLIVGKELLHDIP